MVRSAHEAVVAQSLGERSPFGLLRVDSDRAPDQFIGPATAAAVNLIAKAVRARTRGDGDAAAAFVERAVRLPYDEHEGWWPALHAASMAVFEAITEDLEGAAEGDESWLDRALDVHARAAGVGREELGRLLAVVGQDYQLTHDEQRRLRAVRREVDGASEGLMGGWGPDASPDDRRHVTTAVLDVVVDYVRTLSGPAGV